MWAKFFTAGVVKGLLAQPTQHFSVVPNQFGTRDYFRGIVFHRPELSGCGLEIIRGHCIYWVQFISIIITSALPFRSSGIKSCRLGTPEILNFILILLLHILLPRKHVSNTIAIQVIHENPPPSQLSLNLDGISFNVAIRKVMFSWKFLLILKELYLFGFICLMASSLLHLQHPYSYDFNDLWTNPYTTHSPSTFEIQSTFTWRLEWHHRA